MNNYSAEYSGVLLFGGTFDPFTLAHENSILRLRQNFPDSKIYVAAAGDPKHKNKEGISKFEHRVEMARLALGEGGLLNDGRVVVSEIEKDLSGFTSDTIKAIEEIEKVAAQVVIGGDWVKNFKTWFDAGSILMRGVWVIQRMTEEVAETDLLSGMNLVPGEPINGYSGAARVLKDKDKLVKWVRPSVADYMEREKLHAFAS